MVLTFQDEKSLQDALNLWQDYDPKVIKKGALYSIINLPDLGNESIINGNFADGLTDWNTKGEVINNALAITADGSTQQILQVDLWPPNEKDNLFFLFEYEIKNNTLNQSNFNLGDYWGASIGSYPDLADTKGIHKKIIQINGVTVANALDLWFENIAISGIAIITNISLREIL